MPLKPKDALPVPSEKEVQKSILHYLQLRGFLAWRNNSGAVVSKYKGKKYFFHYGLVGSGDIFGVRKDGKFFSIEVKKKGKKPTDSQVEFMDKVNASNGLAILAYSLDDVIASGL